MISFNYSLFDREKQDENYSYNNTVEIDNQGNFEKCFQIFNYEQESQGAEENHEEIYFLSDYSKTRNENIQIEKLKEIDSKKTKPTTITSPVKKNRRKKSIFKK